MRPLLDAWRRLPACVVAVVVFCAACELERPVCSTAPAPAFRIEVVDAGSGAPLAAGAAGAVYSGTVRVDTLRPASTASDERLLESGWLAEGTYRVRVIRPGYAAWEMSDVAAGGAGSACTGPRVMSLRAPLVASP